MDIILFALGVICIIVGLPFCFSCQVRALWEKMSRIKASQTNQPPYQHVRRNRAIGSILIIFGVLLILTSLPEITSVF
jgi:threonine/homoserine/homoserine lactone efflux protein